MRTAENPPPGEHTPASTAYRRFAELWTTAEAEFQPRVRRARARIAALGG